MLVIELLHKGDLRQVLHGLHPSAAETPYVYLIRHVFNLTHMHAWFCLYP